MRAIRERITAATERFPATRIRQLQTTHKVGLAATATILAVASFAIVSRLQDASGFEGQNAAQSTPAAADAVRTQQNSTLNTKDAQQETMVDMQSTNKSENGQDSSQSSGTVTINGQTEAIPADGNYSRSVTNGSSRSSVDIKSNTHNSGSSGSSSNSSKIQVDIRQ